MATITNEQDFITLTGSDEDDNIKNFVLLGGGGDYLDDGKGTDQIYLNDDATRTNATIALTGGRNTITGLHGGFDDETSDVISVADLSKAKISYDGKDKLKISGSGFRAQAAVNATDGGYIEQIFQSGDITAKAAIAAKNSTLDAANGANYFVGEKSAVDFSNVSGTVIADLSTDWGSSIDGEAVSFQGIDKLYAGSGNTTLKGSSDKETLASGAGNDELTGGKGKDIFIIGGGNDTITDYAKQDEISIGSANISEVAVSDNNITLTFDNNNSLTLDDAANTKITFRNGSKKTANYFADHAIIDGSQKGASLTATTTTFSAANNSKLGTIDGSAASSAINITGNSKKNYIVAGDNGATLSGGKGKDSLVGGEGEDLFIYENKSGNKTIVNYAEGEIISLGSGAQVENASVKGNGDVILKVGSNKLTVKDADDKAITISENGTIKTFNDGMIYDSAGSSVVIPAKYKSSRSAKTLDAAITNVDASEAKKKLNLVASATTGVTMTGGKGKDTLTGGMGDDYISGGKGKDILTGGAGADSLWGGKGNDTLYGGDGSDTFIFHAGDGKDFIADYAQGDMIQILNKNGTDYADFTSINNNGTLTISAKGGGKIIMNNIQSMQVNINGENYIDGINNDDNGDSTGK